MVQQLPDSNLPICICSINKYHLSSQSWTGLIVGSGTGAALTCQMNERAFRVVYKGEFFGCETFIVLEEQIGLAIIRFARKRKMRRT